MSYIITVGGALVVYNVTIQHLSFVALIANLINDAYIVLLLQGKVYISEVEQEKEINNRHIKCLKQIINESKRQGTSSQIKQFSV